MIGGPVIRQHLVEFIRGTGIVTNGVADATSLNGPFTWVVPAGVTNLIVDATGAGGGGQAGAAFSAGVTSMGGGTGNGAGYAITGVNFAVVPGQTLTITLGAGGPSRPAGDSNASNPGGNTSISGPGVMKLNPADWTDSTLVIRGGDVYFGSAPTASVGGQGLASDGRTGAGEGGSHNSFGYFPFGGTNYGFSQGGQGGAGNASGAVAGFSGGGLNDWTGPLGYLNGLGVDSNSGTTDGTISRGGGGNGVTSIFGAGGRGGSNSIGLPGNGYGAGGGGGAGGFASGAGGDGYVGFFFWKAD